MSTTFSLLMIGAFKLAVRERGVQVWHVEGDNSLHAYICADTKYYRLLYYNLAPRLGQLINSH